MILPVINGKYEFTLPTDVNYTSLQLSCHPVIIDRIDSRYVLSIPLRSINTITYIGKTGVIASFINTGLKDYLITDRPETIYTVRLPPPSESGASVHITMDTGNSCFPALWLGEGTTVSP